MANAKQLVAQRRTPQHSTQNNLLPNTGHPVPQGRTSGCPTQDTLLLNAGHPVAQRRTSRCPTQNKSLPNAGHTVAQRRTPHYCLQNWGLTTAVFGCAVANVWSLLCVYLCGCCYPEGPALAVGHGVSHLLGPVSGRTVCQWLCRVCATAVPALDYLGACHSVRGGCPVRRSV